MAEKIQRPIREWRERGFTLIELMVVIVIIGLLATVVTLNVVKSGERAKQTKARADITVLGGALDLFKVDSGFYPETEQGMEALIFLPAGREAKNWQGPYLGKKKTISLDPWRNEYIYISPGLVNPDSYDLYSLGADGVDGGEGFDADILSWEYD